MKDFYLKYKDEDEARELLYIDDIPKYQNIDHVGIIYELNENASEDDEDRFIAKEGWHVNIRLVDNEDEEGLSEFEVFPNLPVRVWG
jgi:hypothetical protein